MKKRVARKVMRRPTHRESTYQKARQRLYPAPAPIVTAFLDLSRASALGTRPLRQVAKSLRRAFR